MRGNVLVNATSQAADIFREAARLNREDPLRRGSLLIFPHYGQVVMTGDIHGHRRNFEKLRRFCDLPTYAARHVILHELLHEDVDGVTRKDDSHELCLQAAAWKCEHPEQVHFLLSNHELAQVTGHDISKNGRAVTLEFAQAVRQAYGSRAESVLEAMYEFIRSFPLAGRTPNRVFLSHSLPGARELPVFDPAVLARTPTREDLSDRGSAHALVWGRYQTAEVLTALRQVLDVDYFVCGHQPQETGFDVWHERMLILASDHNHGVFLPLDLSKPVTMERMTRSLRRYAEIE
jgi:hypothetical protein